MARWMRLAKPLPNAANAVYNAAAFAGATALAVTELLAESGGGRGGRKGGGEAATEAGFAAIAPVGWLRVANALPNGKNAVCNAAAFAGAAALAVTELLPEGGGGRDGRKGGGEAANGGRLPAIAWAGWLRVANALPKRQERRVQRHGTQRHGTQRNDTQRHETLHRRRALVEPLAASASLAPETTKEPCLERSGEKADPALHERTKSVHSMHCVRRWALHKPAPFWSPRRPNHQPSGSHNERPA